MTAVRFALWGLSLWVASTLALAQTPDEARTKAIGQHLARECVTCHRLDGVDNGIPSIIGWKIEDFVDTMGFYKGGQRPNQAMMSVAQSLDDEQTKALAVWFADQPPAAKKAPAAPPKKK